NVDGAARAGIVGYVEVLGRVGDELAVAEEVNGGAVGVVLTETAVAEGRGERRAVVDVDDRAAQVNGAQRHVGIAVNGAGVPEYAAARTSGIDARVEVKRTVAALTKAVSASNRLRQVEGIAGRDVQTSGEARVVDDVRSEVGHEAVHDSQGRVPGEYDR